MCICSFVQRNRMKTLLGGLCTVEPPNNGICPLQSVLYQRFQYHISKAGHRPQQSGHSSTVVIICNVWYIWGVFRAIEQDRRGYQEVAQRETPYPAVHARKEWRPCHPRSQITGNRGGGRGSRGPQRLRGCGYRARFLSVSHFICTCISIRT